MRGAVTVVIPTRDRWRPLSRALTSALRQEAVAFEVVVVDDGSRSAAPGWLTELDDPRVRLYRREASEGPASARNLGIEHAEGEWVAFLDDDDIWAPQKLAAQLACASRSADFVYSSAVVVNGDLEPIRLARGPSPAEFSRRIRIENVVPGGGSNLMVRTELARDLRGFDVNVAVVEDWELWIRLAASGTPAACPEVHIAFVHHPESRVIAAPDLRPDFAYLARRHPVAATQRRSAEIIGARWRAHAHRSAGRRLAAAAEYARTGIAVRSPGMLLRAGGTLLGERIMKLGQPRPELPARSDIRWLESYRGVVEDQGPLGVEAVG